MYSSKKLFLGIVNLPIIMAGVAIVKIPFFSSYKLYLLSTWRDVGKRSWLDKLLFRFFFAVWVKFEYLKEKNPDEREKLKTLAMGGESGKQWAAYYQETGLDLNRKVGVMTLNASMPAYEEISDILRNAESEYLVIQIGSSSGREIAYYANEFGRHEYIGTDIYDEVIEYARSKHPLPNLKFIKSSAKHIRDLIINQKAKSPDSKVLIYSFSCLQYVQPEHVIDFFNSLVEQDSLEVIVCDASSEANGSPDELKTSIWRGDFSYTHDYKWYAEASGFKTVKCEIVRPYFPYERFPMHKNTVHYYYYGKLG